MKPKYEEVHPGVAWHNEPPKINDKLPAADPLMKPKKKLCPRYYNQCWKTECHSGQCVD